MLSNTNHTLYLHIQNLVQALNNKKTSNNAKNELVSLIDTIGVEAEKLTLFCLLEIVDFKELKNQNTKKEQLKVQFLIQRLSICTDSSAFLDYFAEVIESLGQKHNVIECINDLFKHLKLAVPVQIIMALSLSQSPNQLISKEGIILLKKKLTEYCRVGKAFHFPDNILNDLLYLIRTSAHFENMKKEVSFLVESNSNARPSTFAPLLTGNTENSETDTENLSPVEETPTNIVKIWEIMKDLGPTCTHNPESVERLLSDFPNLVEDDILETLLLMSNNSTSLDDKDSRALNHTYHAIKTHDWSTLLSDSSTKEASTTWKVNNFLEACNKKYKLDWSNVIAALDRPNLHFKDPSALIFLFKSFQRFKKVPGFRFPTNILFDRWNHFCSHIDFMINLIQAGQPETVFFTDVQKRTISAELYPNLKPASLNPQTLQFFTSLDILENLVELSESNYYNEIRSLFDLPLEKTPDMLLFGLLEIRPKYGIDLLNELYTQLFLHFLTNYSTSAQIIEKTWKKKPQVLISAFSELYKKEVFPLDITKILEIIEGLPDALQPMLNNENFEFSVNLGAAAAKKGLINFEEWISERIKTVGDDFVPALLNYLIYSVFEPCRTMEDGQQTDVLEKSQLSLESVMKVFQSLIDPNMHNISQKNKTIATNHYKELYNYFPEAEAKVPLSGADEVANTAIEKLFEGNISIADLITMLMGYKNSEDEKEKDIAMCIISNLLDESRFFSTYKHKMLMIMAQVYGALIKSGVIEGKTRDLAFLIILDTVKQKESRKLFEFGVNALLMFRERLYEWPTKASQLFYIDNLRQFSFELLEQIQYDLAANNVEVEYPEEYLVIANSRGPKAPNGEIPADSNPANLPEAQPTAASAIPANPLSPRQMTLEDILSYFDKEPSDVPEETKNKITLAVNNCTDANVFQKALEIKGLLKDDNIIIWFARHLIAQKAHKDSNRHETYINLVEKISKKEVFNVLTKETYTLFKHVLMFLFNSPEKAALNGKDKNLLKNLGSWLGLLTIARNKPIIMKEFDIKTLILNAHESKKLDHILPLICKILIQGNQAGSVFKPNNAWMNAILSILAEIAEMQDIKMALKYEIQMLFRNLGLNEGDITPSKLFQARKLRKKNAQQAQNHASGSIENYLNTEELIKYMKVNFGIPKPVDIDFKTLTAHALSNAIKKTLPNVSDASTLALITSKRLVLKDFATEPDEKNLLHGLDLTIQSLAENLTLVTSKRPLAENFQMALEEQLHKYHLDNKEKIIEAIIANNLDIGCMVIRNAVVREALTEASHDPEILQALERRKMAREKGTPLYDGSSAQIWSSLPDALKPNLRGLSKEELKIYEGFGSGNLKKMNEDN